MNNERNLQVTARPAKFFLFIAQRDATTGGDYHHRVIQFTGLTQCAEHTVDLLINISAARA